MNTSQSMFALLSSIWNVQFNARSESMSEKASFRRLVPKRRCLVAVEGYVSFFFPCTNYFATDLVASAFKEFLHFYLNDVYTIC